MWLTHLFAFFCRRILFVTIDLGKCNNIIGMRENQNKSKTVAAGETRRLTDPFRLNCRLLLNRKIRFKIPLAVANANIFRREQNNTRYVLSNTNKILQFCQNTHTHLYYV